MTIRLKIPGDGRFSVQGLRHIQLLVEAFKASSDRISPQPKIQEIHIVDGENKESLEIVTKLIQLQLLSIPTLQSWTMAQPGRLNNFSPEIRMEPDDP